MMLSKNAEPESGTDNSILDRLAAKSERLKQKVKAEIKAEDQKQDGKTVTSVQTAFGLEFLRGENNPLNFPQKIILIHQDMSLERNILEK